MRPMTPGRCGWAGCWPHAWFTAASCAATMAPADADSASALANHDRITYPSLYGLLAAASFGLSRHQPAVNLKLPTVPVSRHPRPLLGNILPGNNQRKESQTCKADCQSDSLHLFGDFLTGNRLCGAHDNSPAVQHGNR